MRPSIASAWTAIPRPTTPAYCWPPARSGLARSVRQRVRPTRPSTIAVREVLADLAQAIVRDAEGATKFITIDVVQGASSGGLPRGSPIPSRTRRWSRPHFSPATQTGDASSRPSGARPSLRLDVGQRVGHHIWIDVCIARNGGRAPEYSGGARRWRSCARPEICVRVDSAAADRQRSARSGPRTCRTTYVPINAEYRS